MGRLILIGTWHCDFMPGVPNSSSRGMYMLYMSIGIGVGVAGEGTKGMCCGVV